MKFLILASVLFVLSISQNSFAALTPLYWGGSSAAPEITDASFTTVKIMSNSIGSNVSIDFGVNQILSSFIIYTGAAGTFPNDFDIDCTSTPVLNSSGYSSAIWVNQKSVRGLSSPPASTLLNYGFSNTVNARACRFVVKSTVSPSPYINLGHLAFNGSSSDTNLPVTADTYTTIQAIKADTNIIISKFTNVSSSQDTIIKRLDKMEPGVITQSVSFILGSFTSIAFVLAANRFF